MRTTVDSFSASTTFTVADPKFMLDICAKLWYNAFCNCGYSTSASISAFQAEEVGSIPIARSIQKRRWFVQNQRLSLYSGPTFGLTSDFESQKALAKSKKKRAGRLPSSSFPARFFSQSQIWQKGKAPLLRWK